MDERADPWLYRRAPRLWHAVRPAKWAVRRCTASLRATPDLLLVGAPRCSTTSMFWALAKHPGVDVPWEKEPHYFDTRYDRGPGWYRAHFALRTTLRATGRLAFEATPSLLPHPHAHERVHALRPDARLLVLLRDPIERAHSEWALFRSLGWEQGSFADVVGPWLERGPAPTEGVVEGEPPYLCGGRYADHLDRWRRLFPAEQLLVVTFDELVEDSDACLERVLRFVGLDTTVRPEYPAINAREREPLDAALRDSLERYFRPSLERLRSRYGVELSVG